MFFATMLETSRSDIGCKLRLFQPIHITTSWETMAANIVALFFFHNEARSLAYQAL